MAAGKPVSRQARRQALPPPSLLASAPFRTAMSDVERSVIDAFATATGTTTVGADDDFFEIGGDSLSATTLIAHLNAERDITGLLLHRKGRRTQFLEGDEAEVRALRELTLWFRVRAARPGTPPGNS